MAIPLCPYFNDCAGCTLQQVDYFRQLEHKKQILARAVNLNSEEVKVYSAEPYHYRNRLEFLFSAKGFGLRNQNGKIIPITRCAIAEEKVNLLLTEVEDFFYKIVFQKLSSSEAVKTFQGLVIRTTRNDASSLSIVIKSGSAQQEWVIEQLKQFAQISKSENIIITLTEKSELYSNDYLVLKGQDYLEESFLGKKLQFPVQGFFQNNSLLAEEMQKYVNNLLSKKTIECTKKAQLLDLYSGVGVFGIINANLFQKVTMVENFAPSMEYTKKNSELNKIRNAEAYAFEARKMRRLKFSNWLYVITDPPRIGMEMETINIIKSLKPQTIIYVSCNVEQLKKDLLKFKNYTVKSAVLFDFFPQTKHLEAVVELCKITTFSEPL